MNRSLSLGLLGLAVAASFGAHLYRDAQPRYVPRDAASDARYAEGALQWLSKLRANVETGQVEPGDHQRMSKAVAAHVRNQRKAADYQWIEMGPDNIGGRVRGICVDQENTLELWAGGVSGGLFHSLDGANTWQRVTSFSTNIMVSSIAIMGNGHLYVATGSQWENPYGGASSGFIGNGLFRSDDDGGSFTQVLTPVAPWNGGTDWSLINRIKADPNNADGLYIAASNPGARYYDESDNAVTSPLPTTGANQPAYDVEVSYEGATVLFAVGTGDAWRSTDWGQTFVRMDGAGGNPGVGLADTQVNRLEMAISPDPIIGEWSMYAIGATSGGRMSGVWYSGDRGDTWMRIWPHNLQGNANAVPDLDIFRSNSQGNYDNAIAVRPGHFDEVWVGGVELWKTTLNGQPNQLAMPDGSAGCFTCVHSDVHEIVFADEFTAYVGCDGGVYKSPNGGFNFYACNQDLSITQFYSMSYNANGQVAGGTQDNGSLYIAGLGTNPVQEAVGLTGGDGFDCELSQMDTNTMFTTLYYGGLYRSNDRGNNFGEFYDDNVPVDPDATLGVGLGDFNTNFKIFENPKDLNSPDMDTVIYEIAAGDTIFPGETRAVPFRGDIFSVLQYGEFTNTTGAPIAGPWTTDTLIVQDRITSMLAVGFSGTEGVWMTRGSMNFNVTPEWAEIAESVGGNTTCLEFSKDGDALFYGTDGGDVYRITGLNSAYTLDELNALAPVLILSGSGIVTGLGADPSNVNGLVATFGLYGGSQKVRRTDLALQPNPTWTNIWNVPTELQGMPCYDACVHKDNSNIVAVGTEFGVWITDDGGSSWTMQTNGIQGVPVFSVRQQTWNWENNPVGPDYIKNPNVIYAGTHGRGIFRTEALVSVRPIDNGSQGTLGGLLMMPNPANTQSVVSFDLTRRGDVLVNVYDLGGSLVRTITRKNMAASRQNVTIPVGDLMDGTYIVEVRSGSQRTTGRLVVMR